MNNLTIPAILAATIMVAGVFAFAPVEQASTVHTSSQSSSKYFTLTGVVSPDTGTDDAVDESALWSIDQPFQVVGASITFSADTGTDCDLAAANIRTDFIPEAGVTEPNPGLINAATDTRILLDLNDASSLVFGSDNLSIAAAEASDCDADSRGTINVVIETSGTLTTAPTATIQTDAAAGADSLAQD